MSVDLESLSTLFSSFSDLPELTQRGRRNHFTSFLVSVADQNCETFLNRTFANKATLDTSRNTVQDVLTGSSVAASIPSPPVAAGLGIANLIFGKTLDNVNATFFYEKTFQAIGSAIYLERSSIREQVLRKSDLAYPSYTMFDVLSDLRRYESACSIRVGVSKLQSLAEDRLREIAEQERRFSALVSANASIQNKEAAIKGLTEQLQRNNIDTQERTTLQVQLDAAKNELGPTKARLQALEDSARAVADVKATEAKVEIDAAKRQAELAATRVVSPPATAASASP
jgi:hypothetical protein